LGCRRRVFRQKSRRIFVGGVGWDGWEVYSGEEPKLLRAEALE